MEPTRHHTKPSLYSGGDKFMMIRQVLNLIFMIGAIIGVIIFLTGNRTVGTIVILISMVFKIIECVLRFIR